MGEADVIVSLPWPVTGEAHTLGAGGDGGPQSRSSCLKRHQRRNGRRWIRRPGSRAASARTRRSSSRSTRATRSIHWCWRSSDCRAIPNCVHAWVRLRTHGGNVASDFSGWSGEKIAAHGGAADKRQPPSRAAVRNTRQDNQAKAWPSGHVGTKAIQSLDVVQCVGRDNVVLRVTLMASRLAVVTHAATVDALQEDYPEARVRYAPTGVHEVQQVQREDGAAVTFGLLSEAMRSHSTRCGARVMPARPRCCSPTSHLNTSSMTPTSSCAARTTQPQRSPERP